MLYTPSVYAVGETYQILVRCDASSMMWVRVGDECFYDDSNGVLRSETQVHRMTVPMQLLDEARAYTICEKKMICRKAHHSLTFPQKETTFGFTPVPLQDARAYLISDAHCRTEEPIRAAKAFGEIDFLMFNGDMPQDSAKTSNFDTVFVIAQALTGGTKPIVFARGNHDLRGLYADRYTDWTPNDGGRTYYTFRLGSIWGLVLDCGEDKPDGHVEYGGTICCSDFRKRETRFIERIARSGEYLADGIDTRLVLVHHPFTHVLPPPFDIEQDTYACWAKLMRDAVHPDVMLSGHLHESSVFQVGGDHDDLGQCCDVIVAGEPRKGWYSGAGLTFSRDAVSVVFTDSDGNSWGAQTIPKPKAQ